MFNRKTNVSFVKVVDQTTIKVRTYDYYRGWVLCSDGAVCASVVAAHKAGFTTDFVTVELEFGSLMVQYNKNAILVGSATKVFECEYEEEEICY